MRIRASRQVWDMHESVIHCLTMQNSCCRNAKRKVTHKRMERHATWLPASLYLCKIPSIGSDMRRDDVMRLMRARAAFALAFSHNDNGTRDVKISQNRERVLTIYGLHVHIKCLVYMHI